MKICLLYDFKGWAWYHRAQALKKHISNPIMKIHIAPRSEAYKYADADFVVVFGPYELISLAAIHPSKRIIGSANPYTVRHMENILSSGLARAGLVNSLWQYNYLHCKENIYYLPNGVNTDFFSPADIGQNELCACWVGNANAHNEKGLNMIKSAVAAAGIKLNICDVNAAKNSNVTLSHQEIRDQIYYQSTFYICMSKFEGTPNPGLEALACGLPVISTHVGNMQDIIKDEYNGYLIDRDEKSLFDVLEKLKNADWKIMSQNARQSVLNGWRWVDQARRYEKMFLELWNSNRRLGLTSRPRLTNDLIEEQRIKLKQFDNSSSKLRANEKETLGSEWKKTRQKNSLYRVRT